jgi:hypothetical protein
MSFTEGNFKCVCAYCGVESFIEAKMIENSGEKVSATSSPKSSEFNEKIGYSISYGVSNCSYSTTLLLAIFTGFLGGHRYYTGRIGSAIIQTFTIGGFYIWWLIDIILILSGNFKDSQGRPLDKGKKTNSVFVKTILCIVLGIIIMGAIVNATGAKGDEASAPLILFGSFALSAMIVNINKIYGFLLKKYKSR